MKQTGIIAITLAVALAACGAPAPAAQPVEEAPVSVAPEVVEQPPAQEESEAPAVEAEAPVAETEAPTEEEQPAPGSGTLYVIDPAQSEARFVVDEILNGAPNTVIGATNAIEGQIVADLSNAGAAEVGPVRVDLSMLATDHQMRNRALRTWILETGNPQNQYAVFAPTGISGLPPSAVVGQSYPVQITGDLTVKGTTTPVTFEGQVTPVSDTRLEGAAALTARYQDLGVTIPRLPPQVASVADEVRLEIAFVALAS